MIYLQLFLSFFKIGILGFGGGMAIISLVQNEVEQYGWMTAEEFIDIVAISQVTPGPVGMNVATYVGYTASGTVWGSLLASMAIVLPSLIIMGLICYLYESIRNHWSENR
ncbi:MAG: chromate transporter, partial [Paludibacteraceae bacterium]|nr:chromate transporter [Paludibacteraceae bacterium]